MRLPAVPNRWRPVAGPFSGCLHSPGKQSSGLFCCPAQIRDTRQTPLQLADLIGLRIDCFDYLRRPRKQPLPCVNRLGADPQTFGHLAHRVAPILDLRHGTALELICELCSGYLVLLASKITKQSVYKSRGTSLAQSGSSTLRQNLRVGLRAGKRLQSAVGTACIDLDVTVA